MLHYFVTRFFAPVAISGYVQDGMIHANLVQDHPSVNNDLVLNISVHSWKTFSTLWNKTIQVNATAKHSVSCTLLSWYQIVYIFLCHWVVYYTCKNFTQKALPQVKWCLRTVIGAKSRKGDGARCAREAPTYSIFIKFLAQNGVLLV